MSVSKVILSGESLTEADVVCTAIRLHCAAAELRGLTKALYINDSIDSDALDEFMNAIESIDTQAKKVIDWVENTRGQWNDMH